MKDLSKKLTAAKLRRENERLMGLREEEHQNETEKKIVGTHQRLKRSAALIKI